MEVQWLVLLSIWLANSRIDNLLKAAVLQLASVTSLLDWVQPLAEEVEEELLHKHNHNHNHKECDSLMLSRRGKLIEQQCPEDSDRRQYKQEPQCKQEVHRVFDRAGSDSGADACRALIERAIVNTIKSSSEVSHSTRCKRSDRKSFASIIRDPISRSCDTATSRWQLIYEKIPNEIARRLDVDGAAIKGIGRCISRVIECPWRLALPR